MDREGSEFISKGTDTATGTEAVVCPLMKKPSLDPSF